MFGVILESVYLFFIFISVGKICKTDILKTFVYEPFKYKNTKSSVRAIHRERGFPQPEHHTTNTDINMFFSAMAMLFFY